MPADLRRRIVAIYLFLAIFNAGAWLWAVLAFRHYPVLLGTAFLAYSFGLRHAVDADHIAAIDNVTRKLMNEGRRPVGVGLMFSLGHSTVVVAGSLLIATATVSLERHTQLVAQIGGLVGTLVSTAFLLGIAALNLVVLRSVYRTFRRVRSGGPYTEEELQLTGSGMMGRVLRRVFGFISRSWHMYPLGLLFGLGFDTATEIGLLGISAAEASRGLSPWAILVFPVLFAAGMSLVDTTDNILMLGAYGWAFARPIRKLYYNMTVTAISVLVAVLVGGIELLSIVGPQLGLKGLLWDDVASISDNFGAIGMAIIGIFVVSWFVSTAIYKLRRYDELEPAVTPAP